MKVFITRPIPENGIAMLKAKGYEVVVNTSAADRPATEEEMIAGLKGADALLPILTDHVTATVIESGLPTLKIIANYGLGYDNIDLASARARNIMVTNTPSDAMAEAVAEHTFALMLSLTRRISESERFLKAGKYHAWGPSLLLGDSINGKTLGIVGLGRIGFRVAHYAAKGFGMQVAYTDPKQNHEFEAEHHARYYANIDLLLPECDIVSLHVPLVPSTRHLINEERLKKMKHSAYLINTARGAVVDEAALAKALGEQWIKGAALDVFEHEPEVYSDLLKFENVVLTPHTASATQEVRSKMSETAALNIIEALEGRTPPNLVK